MATARYDNQAYRRGNGIRLLLVVLTPVAVAGLFAVILGGSASPVFQTLVERARRLSPWELAGGTVALLLVSVAPWGAWAARRARRGIHTRRARIRIAQLSPLGELLRLSPLDFGTATLDTFLALDPKQFERAIGALLAAHHYRDVVCLGQAGDNGVDLTCKDRRGRRFVVQCKRYAPSHRVGAPRVQQFWGAITHHNAHRGLFITTSTFTKSAIEEYAERHRDRLSLIEGPQIVAMLRALAIA